MKNLFICSLLATGLVFSLTNCSSFNVKTARPELEGRRRVDQPNRRDIPTQAGKKKPGRYQPDTGAANPQGNQLNVQNYNQNGPQHAGGQINPGSSVTGSSNPTSNLQQPPTSNLGSGQSDQNTTYVSPQQVLKIEGQPQIVTLEQLLNISVNSPNKADQEFARLKAIDIVNNQLSLNDIKKVSSDSSFGFLRGYALFRLAEDAMERKEPSEAQSFLNGVIEFMPGSDLESRAKDYIVQIERSQRVSSKTIGTILPLSGKNAAIGQKALRAIQMGLGLNLPGSSFRLAIVDSEGSPDRARVGVERLSHDDGALAIIGSLLSKTAFSVASKAEEYSIPTIALSQKAGITEVGPTVFRNAITSEMQVRFLVRTLMRDLGMKRFAMLYPNEPYGVEYANIFWDEVLARGGTIAGAQTYNPSDTDFRNAAQKLVGTYYTEARMEEYKLRLKEIQEAAGPKKSSRQNSEEDILPPIVDFDAIFIPDDARNLGQVAAFLAYVGIKNVKLIGTNLWNIPGISKRAGNFSNSLIFVDSTSPELVKTSSSNFITEYKNLFGELPGPVEIQAYDSALILRQLILEGASSRESLLKKLSSLKDFPGALGRLSVNDDREIVRPLTLLTVEKGEIIPYGASKQ